MKIFQSIARWLCAFLVSVVLSIWIIAATINFTIADRSVVESWVSKSGVYDSVLSTINVSTTSTDSSGTIITNSDVQQALNETFDAAYIEDNTNTAIDAFYNWLDGKTTEVSFAIDVQDYSDAFVNNLTDIVQAKLEALPQCTGTNTYPSCLPSTTTAESYAKQIAKLSNNSSFLSEPITQDSLSQTFPALTWLPFAVQLVKTLTIVLPIALLALAGLYIVLSQDKMRGLSYIGKQFTFGSVAFLIGGIAAWMLSGLAGFTSSESNQQIINLIVNPLIKVVLASFGQILTILSGAVVLVGVLIWILATVLIKKRSGRSKSERPATPRQDSSSQTSPPAAPASPKPPLIQ